MSRYLCIIASLLLSLSSESLSTPVLHDEEAVGILDTPKATCPVPELITPCICDVSSTTGELTVDCSAVSSSSELEQIFLSEPFPAVNMDNFRLVNNPYVTYLLPESFHKTAFKNIEITSNPELSMISENTFESSKDILRSLDLNSNALTSFVLLDSSTYPSLELLDLGSNQISANIREFLCSPALKTLRLHSNLIPAIDANAFSTCGTLETLLVGGNSFSVLSQDAFAGLTNIKVIRVNVCPELTVIQTGAFPIATGSVLERIELNGNPKLTIFEPGWITQTDLPCNTRIEMMVSPLTTLEQLSFEPILTTFMGAGCGGLIDLMDTPIECDCDLSWLLENPGYLIHVAGKCVNLEGTPQIQDQDPTDWSNSCKSFACQFVHVC